MRLLAVLVGLMAAVSVGGASAASTDSPHGVSTFFRARPDHRMCPSPACGGWFVARVNHATTTCPGGRRARECYVAELDLDLLRLGASERAGLERALAAGRALLRGRILPVPGRATRRLLAVEGWIGYGKALPKQPVRRIEDNGVRCVTTPCFSLHTSVLNGTAHEDVSGVDLDGAGAPRSVVEQALGSLSTTSILAVGATMPDGEGGRTLVAQRFWLLATRPPER